MVAAAYWKVSEGFAGLTSVIGTPLPVTYSPLMYALCIVMDYASANKIESEAFQERLQTEPTGGT